MEHLHLSRALCVTFMCLLLLGGLSQTAEAVTGDTCADPFSVTSLPYSDTGNTCSFNHDTGGYCVVDSGAADVVYAFTPAADYLIDISLCGSLYDTVLYVFEGDCTGDPIVCDDDSCGTQSEIDSLVVYTGTTYYIIVDGYQDLCGEYTLNITNACDDGNACTEDVYDAGSGQCTYLPIECDDGNPFTMDNCDPQTGCVYSCGSDDGYEDNDDQQTAWPIQLGEQVEAVSVFSDDDVYSIELYAGMPIEITTEFTNEWGDIDLYFYDSAYNQIASSTSYTNIEQILWTVTQDGIYYVRVMLYSGVCNGYVLSVKPNCPDLTVQLNELEPFYTVSPVTLTGTVSGDHLAEWQLSYTGPEDPNWVTFYASPDPVMNDTLAEWHIAGLPLGAYTLELLAVDECYGFYTETTYMDSLNIGYAADLNRSGNVNLADFAMFAEQWLQEM